MELEKFELNKYLELEEFKIRISNKQLLKFFKKTYERTVLIFNQIQENKKNNLEIVKEETNPILWQCGHIIYFYKKHCRHYFDINFENESFLNNAFDFYDSFITKLEFRYDKNKLLNFDILLDDYKNLYNIIYKKIESGDITHKHKYVLMLSILHNEMHIEALIFTCLNMNYNLPNFLSIRLTNLSLRDYSKKIINDIEFVDIKSRSFIQGSRSNSYFLSFDNERPVFRKYVDSFQMSKYPITERQYLQFVLEGGYNKEQYWTKESWDWKLKNEINCPLYWKLNNLDKRYTNYPVMNVSWYEAQAYCKWAGYRLPKECEWEYVATNCGKTVFPWGDKMESKNCNLNYTINGPLEVTDSRLSFEKNNFGVKQLIGNIWEWCEEPIYPYDGFSIDPVYREMSYPFFGFKKICRGGCFAVPDYLIHSRYRNAQMPDCRIQFIGFRVCKKKDDLNLKNIRKTRRYKMQKIINL